METCLYLHYPLVKSPCENESIAKTSTFHLFTINSHQQILNENHSEVFTAGTLTLKDWSWGNGGKYPTNLIQLFFETSSKNILPPKGDFLNYKFWWPNTCVKTPKQQNLGSKTLGNIYQNLSNFLRPFSWICLRCLETWKNKKSSPRWRFDSDLPSSKKQQKIPKKQIQFLWFVSVS